jgi:hypothetical protein
MGAMLVADKQWRSMMGSVAHQKSRFCANAVARQAGHSWKSLVATPHFRAAADEEGSAATEAAAQATTVNNRAAHMG